MTQTAGAAMRTDLDVGARSMARGAVANLSGSLAASAFAFVTLFVITQLVPASAIGLAAIGTTFAGLALVPALLGLDTGVVRFVARGAAAGDERSARASFQAALAVVTATSGVATGVIWWKAPWLADSFYRKPDAAELIRITALSLPGLALGRVVASAIQGFGLMAYSAWLGILRRFGYFAAALPLVALGFGSKGLGVAAVVGAWATLAGSLFLLVRASPRALTIARGPWRLARLLGFSIPQVLTGTLFLAILWTDTLLLGRFGSTSDVGVYSVVAYVLAPATLVSTAVGQMFAPRVAADDVRAADRRELAVMLKRVTHWNTTASVPLFVALALLSAPLLGIFGERYQDGAAALAILAAGQLVNTAAGPVGMTINMSGRPYVNLMNNVLVAGLNVGACLVLIPRYGMSGAAASAAAALTLVNVLKLVEVRLIFGIHPFRADSARVFLAAGLAAAVTSPVVVWPDWPTPLAQAVAGGVVLLSSYVLGLRALGLSDEDRELVRAAWARLRRSLRSGRRDPAARIAPLPEPPAEPERGAVRPDSG